MDVENMHIRARALIEVLGKPKEYVEAKIKEYVELISKNDTIMVMNEKIADVREQGGLFSAFAEVEIVIKGLERLFLFCIEYMPSSIEIIKPEYFSFAERDLTHFINDMLAKLHKVDMIAKQLGTENTVLKKNLQNVIKNNLLVLMKGGINEISGFSTATGVGEDELKRFLKMLIEENRIIEREGKYFLK